MRKNLQRLLAPESFVAIGGRAAEVAIEQSRALGYPGRIWAVHPTRVALAGVPCHRSLSDLPEVPDAAFVAVGREQTVAVVGQLADHGVGGAVCHASGFSEDSEYGAGLERQLVAAAGDLAVAGPNCLGLVNYLDGVALWSDQHGGGRVERGVALISQSGNIALNLSMQRRSLPLAHLVSVGNSAVTGVPEMMAALLEDPRVTAIGLYLETMPDVVALAEVAGLAQRRGVGIVTLKAGGSTLGAQIARSHTSALAGPDALVDALFDRLGIARVQRVEALVEALKLLHVHGPLRGVGPTSIATASCSGGEAAHVADLVSGRSLELPPFPSGVGRTLERILGERVAVGNPLDYHTYIWADPVALRACFAAFLAAGFDQHVLLLDVPRDDRCDTAEFDTVLDAFVAAHAAAPSPAAVVTSLPEGLPEPIRERLLAAGIAPMQGIDDCLSAIAAAATIGRAAARGGEVVVPGPARPQGEPCAWDEPSTKAVLAAAGVPVPRGTVVPVHEAGAAARELAWPLVLKVVSSDLQHKSDSGGVHLDLRSEADVRRAATSVRALGATVLVEEMVSGVRLELLVGIRNDPRVGLALTVGAGGVLAEILDDVVTLLLPVERAMLAERLESLRCWRLVTGFRGRGAEPGPVLDAVLALAAYVEERRDTLVEIEINPLMVGSDGVVAADAVSRWTHPPLPDEEARR
ncbi:acetate--CoA ligase family protein [Nocardioides sp.]|uniref:acetate--CoA ligase family protein n=1 Tax=Nocardioides sp. TaxID=35761 RepID=UPI003D11BA53